MPFSFFSWGLPAGPAFTAEGLRALRSLATDGADDIVARVLAMFDGQAVKLAHEIERALARADWRVLALNAHSLKGACLHVGAQRLAECCRRLETAASPALPEQLEACYREFCTELQFARQELQRILARP